MLPNNANNTILLKSLQNTEPTVTTNFNWEGYNRFIPENFTIINKQKQEVPFVAKPPQQDFLRHMALYLNILILKARKMGFSSEALGVATTKFLTGRNEKCVSMSFDVKAAEKQLNRAKHFIKSYEEINNVKIPLKYDTRTELSFEGVDQETGRRFTNILQVGTAHNTSFGRGDDITFLHLTEVSLSDVEQLMAGVGEAIIEGAHMILETTANGFNKYKTFWDEAMMNRKGFACLFYAPEWEYSQEFLAGRAKKLGRLYQQEYPSTPEEAFIATGGTYIDRLALAQLLGQVKLWEQNHARV